MTFWCDEAGCERGINVDILDHSLTSRQRQDKAEKIAVTQGWEIGRFTYCPEHSS